MKPSEIISQNCVSKLRPFEYAFTRHRYLNRSILHSFYRRKWPNPSLTILSIDQNDESLNRWKASLGISSSPAIPVAAGDQRRCVIKSLALEVQDRSDITIDLTAPGSLESLKSKPFSIKEGAQFRMKANFVVQHDVLSGLKYLQLVKRKGIRVSKNEEMIASRLAFAQWWLRAVCAD